jgi:hypothetical protein
MSDKIDWYPPTGAHTFCTSPPPVGYSEKEIVIYAKTIAEAVNQVLLTPLGFVRHFQVLRISGEKNPLPDENSLEVVVRVYVEMNEANPLCSLSLVELPREASGLNVTKVGTCLTT